MPWLIYSSAHNALAATCLAGGFAHDVRRNSTCSPKSLRVLACHRLLLRIPIVHSWTASYRVTKMMEPCISKAHWPGVYKRPLQHCRRLAMLGLYQSHRAQEPSGPVASIMPRG